MRNCGDPTATTDLLTRQKDIQNLTSISQGLANEIWQGKVKRGKLCEREICKPYGKISAPSLALPLCLKRRSDLDNWPVTA